MELVHNAVVLRYSLSELCHCDTFYQRKENHAQAEDTSVQNLKSIRFPLVAPVHHTAVLRYPSSVAGHCYILANEKIMRGDAATVT